MAHCCLPRLMATDQIPGRPSRDHNSGTEDAMVSRDTRDTMTEIPWHHSTAKGTLLCMERMEPIERIVLYYRVCVVKHAHGHVLARMEYYCCKYILLAVVAVS